MYGILGDVGEVGSWRKSLRKVGRATYGGGLVAAAGQIRKGGGRSKRAVVLSARGWEEERQRYQDALNRLKLQNAMLKKQLAQAMGKNRPQKIPWSQLLTHADIRPYQGSWHSKLPRPARRRPVWRGNTGPNWSGTATSYYRALQEQKLAKFYEARAREAAKNAKAADIQGVF